MVNAMAMTAAGKMKFLFAFSRSLNVQFPPFSDLSASAKPWEVQNETVKGIFEEFYDQGDAERAAGRVPMAMMDRDQPDQQANSQVMTEIKAFSTVQVKSF